LEENMQIVVAILALSFLIIIHEIGHFTVAKLSGIKVLEFSLFMGPRLLSRKRGETEYSIRAVPIGGFVRMEGEEEASDDARAFNRQPLYVRAAVLFCGPFANLIVAVLILCIVFGTAGYSTTVIAQTGEKMPAQEAGLEKGDRIVSFDGKRVYHPNDIQLFMVANKDKPAEIEFIRDNVKRTTVLIPEKIPAQKRYLLGFVPKEPDGVDSTLVESVMSESNAARAGLMVGDRIIELNGTPVSERQQINEFMERNQDAPVKVTILRNGQEQVLTIEPVLSETSEDYNLGMAFETKRSGVFETIGAALGYTVSTVRSVYFGLLWLITGMVSVSQMMGPVGIVSTIGSVVSQSPSFSLLVLNLLYFTAFISINLGVMNLIPFPALDGSKLLLILVEAVRKKAIPPEKEAVISLVGFVVLIMFMIFTTFNDIARIVFGG